MLKRVSRKLAIMFIVSSVAVAMMAGSQWSAQAAGESDAVKGRKELMKKNVRGGMANIKKGAKAGESAMIQKGAEALAEAAEKIPSAFAKKDLSGETRALAAIWEKKSDFDDKAKALGTAAKALVVAVKSGNKAKIDGAMKSVGAACGGCHKAYRAKKK